MFELAVIALAFAGGFFTGRNTEFVLLKLTELKEWALGKFRKEKKGKGKTLPEPVQSDPEPSRGDDV